jgi:hypothetical protein
MLFGFMASFGRIFWLIMRVLLQVIMVQRLIPRLGHFRDKNKPRKFGVFPGVKKNHRKIAISVV